MHNVLRIVSMSSILAGALLASGCASVESVEKAQATADHALSVAEQAQSTATAAQQAAANAQQTADQARSDVNALNSKVDAWAARHRRGQRG